MTRSTKIKKAVTTVLVVLIAAVLLLGLLSVPAQAAGLVDDTINTANEYSKYPLENYQLDFYVDTSWSWLPWNWGDGIGKQVNYGLYAITDFIWTINLYVSNATGYIISEAYSLDFIASTAEALGQSMQAIAGVNRNGLSLDGFYAGFLLLLILVVGVYVAYTGMIKRESTKAVRAVVNFVVVFVLSAAFIAYAPDYISKINEFSADVSNAALSVGTKIVLPDSESKGRDSVDLIRDSLFSIQVKQPWLLLQYDNSDVEEIGESRVESLLSTSPGSNNGKDREEIVKAEIEDRENANLTITKTIGRLGMVFFLFLFNIGISIFIFLLTGTMIFSQVLFIIYAMMLPMSFLLSMIPTFDGMTKRAVTKLFNTILMRAGITLIITTAFSISTMLYKLSFGYPFFLIAFLQIVTFAGIYFKLGDLMGMLSLQSNDSQGVGRQIMRRPRMFMNRYLHRFSRNFRRSAAGYAAGTTAGGADGKGKESAARGASANHTRPTRRRDDSAKQVYALPPTAQAASSPAEKMPALPASTPPEKRAATEPSPRTQAAHERPAALVLPEANVALTELKAPAVAAAHGRPVVIALPDATTAITRTQTSSSAPVPERPVTAAPTEARAAPPGTKAPAVAPVAPVPVPHDRPAMAAPIEAGATSPRTKAPVAAPAMPVPHERPATAVPKQANRAAITTPPPQRVRQAVADAPKPPQKRESAMPEKRKHLSEKMHTHSAVPPKTRERKTPVPEKKAKEIPKKEAPKAPGAAKKTGEKK